MRHTPLERTEHHILEAEKRVAKQRSLIVHLQRDGRSTTEAQEMLQVMVELLDQMRTHAEEIANDAFGAPQQETE
jgi:hypothetical protein